jgi:hypothetical protein
MNTVLQT